MSSPQQSFTSAYQQLNENQKLAVDTIEGPVMVLAGPGTGKTQVLSLRIARILEKTDTPASSILALTFTEAAASEMRARLISLIGSAGYSVPITTFHAFCVELIKEFPEYFPIAKESEPLTELERSEILHSLFENLPLDVLKPINQHFLYVPAVMKAISNLKREGVTPDDFSIVLETSFLPDSETTSKAAQLLLARSKAKNLELLQIYSAYEQALKDSLRYDYEDMILFVLKAFADSPEFLSICQERFLYVLVDEYQDTNTAQNSLVEKLAEFWGESANIFVVGDPHQAIYRFQGASLENTYRFLELYPKAELITLKVGYRCPQGLYDAAFMLTKHTQLPESLPKNLQDGLNTQLLSATKVVSDALLTVAKTRQIEHIFLSKKIADLLQAGVSATEIVVLCRTNKEVNELASMLLSQGIPCSLSGGTSVLDKPHIQQLLMFFSLLLELRSGGAGEQIFTVLSAPWLQFSRIALWTLTRFSAKQSIPLYELFAMPSSELAAATGVALSDLEPIFACITNLKEWGVTERQEPFPDWFTFLLKESGYLAWLLEQPEKFAYLAEIQALTEMVKELSYSDHDFGLQQFVRAISLMQERSIRLSATYIGVESAAVEVTTGHKAKGREWEYVFLAHCSDGTWGNARKSELLTLPEKVLHFATHRDAEAELAEDRRLFYVALTRAKKQFLVSFAEVVQVSLREKTVLPAQFLSEITPIIREQASDKLEIESEVRFLESAVAPILTNTYTPSEREFFAALLPDFRLSVTALNKYLRDTDEFVQDVLLRLPQAKAAHMAFGSAVHKALEFVFRKVADSHEPPTLDTTAKIFENALERELLSTEEFERRLAYGKTILKTYFQESDRFAVEPLYIERIFGSGISTAHLDDIVLSGRIDRVDWLDKAKKLVRVVDYKTGKQRSIGDIEGTTVAAGLSEREQLLPQSIRGPYKRQLLFYKLLADLDHSFPQTVTEGVFEFVEPHKQTGKLTSRVFSLSQDAVEDLKQLIREVMIEIRSLQFLD